MFKFILTLSFLLFNTNAQNCILQVPSDPLNTGLFEPWYVSSVDMVCTQTDNKANAFVEATILDVDTGKFFVYFPLVIDNGQTPSVPPLKAILPLNNIVTLHFGTNGNSLTLKPTIVGTKNSLIDGNCVNGLPNGSIFGQFAYCNSKNFFIKVNQLITTNIITVPPLGLSSAGEECPTTRSYAVVDQDQSDNVLSQYILRNDMSVVQDYPQNRLNVLKIIGNGSDNRLLDIFIDPAIKCIPFKAPDLYDVQIMRSSLALNEIQANTLDINLNTTALVPAIDPMVLDNDMQSLEKLNLYRIGVNQLPLSCLNKNHDIKYCNQLAIVAPPFIKRYQNELLNFASPDVEVANNLMNFLAIRFVNTWNILNCLNLTGLQSPISVTFDPITNIVISNNLITNITQPTTTQATQSSLPTQDTQPTQEDTQPTQDTQPSQDTQATQSTQDTQATQSSLPTQDTQVTQTTPNTGVNILNLCGTSSYNVNCTQPCPNELDTDCVSEGYKCFAVLSNTLLCNYNNYCGTTFDNINCQQQCPNGIDMDCGQYGGTLTCFKIITNTCNQFLNNTILPDTPTDPTDPLSNNYQVLSTVLSIKLIFLFILLQILFF